QPAHRLLLLGHPNGAHAPLANRLEQLVRTDAAAGALRRERRLLAGGGGLVGGVWTNRRRFQEAARPLIDPEKAFHPFPQRAVGPAGRRQIRLALARVVLLQCPNEDVALVHDSLVPHDPLEDSAVFGPGSRNGMLFFSRRVGGSGGGRRVVALDLGEQPGPGIGPQEVRRAWGGAQPFGRL